VIECVRRDAYERVGRSLEAAEDVVFLSHREQHAPQMRDELRRVNDARTLLDVIGWSPSEQPLGAWLDLATRDEPDTTPDVRASRQLASTIRALRRSHGVSIEALALKAGIHPTYLSQIERNERNPSYKKVFSLAQALNLPASGLVRRAEATARLRQALTHAHAALGSAHAALGPASLRDRQDDPLER
jgi:transcriptional regulator with XRE-family HTH domain